MKERNRKERNRKERNRKERNRKERAHGITKGSKDRVDQAVPAA